MRRCWSPRPNESADGSRGRVSFGLVGGSLGLGAATVATAALVFALSVRLRRRELETMRKIGASRGRMRAILASEVLLVVASGVLIAAILTAVVSRFGGVVLRIMGT